MAEDFLALHPKMPGGAGRDAAIDIEDLAEAAVGMQIGGEDAAVRRACRRPRPPRAPPRRRRRRRARRCRGRSSPSAARRSRRRSPARVFAPPETISALAWASAKTKPAQTACTSKAKPSFMPSAACTIVAAEGKVRSAVEVARMIASIPSAAIPALASAALAARVARSDVVCPSAAKWRRSIPVRERIHSSVVSSDASNSEFGTTRSGR